MKRTFHTQRGLPTKGQWCRLVGLFLACAGGLAAADSSAAEFFVATDGDDRWSGRLAAANVQRTDGPLASLAGARDAVRRARAAGELSGGVTVRVRGGRYVLEGPLVLEPVDSGTAKEPVVFEAFADERPVFSGGRVVAGFRRNGPLWETVVAEVKAGDWYFRQLFVDGKRRQRARSPNEGYHRIGGLLPGPKDAHGKAIARDKFVFAPGDVEPWARLGDVNLVLMHSWETSIHPLKSVDAASNIVEFAAPLKEWWCIGYWEQAQRYYVENARELLDRPGEWYLDRRTGTLSYWPMPGERLEAAEVVAPRLTELVRFAGNADEGRFVEHVTLRGLAFHHADWELSPEGNSSTQAAVEVPAAIVADGTRHCTVESCEVAHIGTYAIWLRRGCKDSRIRRNRLFDLGAGGVRIGETVMAKTDVAESSRNLVDNNHIFDGGRVYPAGIGIWVAQSSHNRISHNDVHDLLYSGISIGWNWNDAENRMHHNVIEWNHVHHLVHGVLSDAGLIYCLGVSPGSVIRNNVFHDIWPYKQPPFGWGIYLDATCGSYLVENNLVYNTRSGGLMFNNGGHEHVIQNNIFAHSADYSLWPYNERRPSTLRRNIVYLTQGQLFIPHGERSLADRLAAKEPLGLWDENVYWHTGGADRLRFYRRNFAEWQTLGLDRRSRVADPLFVDAKARDFRLQGDSPALKLGFQPIDVGRVGLYGDAAWVEQVSHAKCPVVPLPPPPQPPKPLEVDDDFEKTPAGSHPAGATVSGEEQGASIAVSEDRAASGKRSLKVTDSKTLQPTWQPHFFYEPHIREGTVRQSFDVWLGAGVQFFTEWRDTTAHPRNVGPSVRFDGSGTISVAGKTIAKIPIERWVHVDVEAQLGKDAPHTFTLTLTPPGETPKVIENLAFGGSEFAELHWLGFSSTAATDVAFFLDNLKIQRRAAE
ncbi:MAG: right-handed parallel beta-helix repeat-containing protein [Candidatus Nealsonbacteria bacterium]|nr:right-handed parallel beta-helix repeat-containing protein [Candidatus Nealsonbacteria bacterium]